MNPSDLEVHRMRLTADNLDNALISNVPTPPDRKDVLLIWESADWIYEILDNPNGPYLRKVWRGVGRPVLPAVDPLVSMVLQLYQRAKDLEDQVYTESDKALSCSFRESYDPDTLEPIGPDCGRKAIQLIRWRDGRLSPACGKHGWEALTEEAQSLIDYVTVIS